MAKRFYIPKVLALCGVLLMGLAGASSWASAQSSAAPATHLTRPLNATPKPTRKAPGLPLKTTPRATPRPIATSPEAATSYESETLSDGSTKYTVAANNFALTLPKGWEVLDLDSETLTGAIATAMKGNPEFEGVLSGQMKQLIAQGIKFYAVDLGSKPVRGQLPTTCNVLVQKIPGKMAMKALVNLTAQQLETIFTLDEPVEQSVLKMPVGDVGFLHYTIPFNLPTGKKINITATQYLVQGKAGLYIVSFSASAAAAKDGAKKFEAAMKTFAFLK